MHEAVHPLERAFTEELGNTARQISTRLKYVTASIILLLLALGAYLSLRIIHSIRGSEEQYRALMHFASDGLFVVDRATGLVLEINECAERMIGRPAAELIGLPYASLFDRPGFQARQPRPTRRPQLACLKQASGEPIEVEVKFSAARWNHREAQLAIVRDVRRRLRTERMLRVATNAMANASEAVVITDGRFRVISVNSAFTAITGFAEAEVIGPRSRLPGRRAAPTAATCAGSCSRCGATAAGRARCRTCARTASPIRCVSASPPSRRRTAPSPTTSPSSATTPPSATTRAS